MVNRGAKRTDREWVELVGPAGANLAVVSESRQANLRRAVTTAIRGRRGAALADEARRLAMEECEPELAIKIAHLTKKPHPPGRSGKMGLSVFVRGGFKPSAD
ncbi:hypothetical protein [Arthrobacter sp. 260]|uniref:hypothetical protein n=1 Tax=Arthrobacter sp. 260 TaxID=2735314 RepID=UPI001491DDFC|nr:hypothetical protein [Arthrobacter sp. 260]NOJ60528.1 hypothetical protein [Arthrobacter sp. 260]